MACDPKELREAISVVCNAACAPQPTRREEDKANEAIRTLRAWLDSGLTNSVIPDDAPESDRNTKTEIGGWMKAVFMQETQNLTVAECCYLAALVEHGATRKSGLTDSERGAAIEAYSHLIRWRNDMWPIRSDGCKCHLCLAIAALAPIAEKRKEGR